MLLFTQNPSVMIYKIMAFCWHKTSADFFSSLCYFWYNFLMTAIVNYNHIKCGKSYAKSIKHHQRTILKRRMFAVRQDDNCWFTHSITPT